MKIVDEPLVQQAEEYVNRFLAEKLTDKIVFHTVDHAHYVVERAEVIGHECGLNTGEINLVKVMAWFHDTGYAVDPEHHEEESIKIAVRFLQEKGMDEQLIEKVRKGISSTHIPQQPDNKLSEVLCDADLAHLASEDYFERLDNLRLEWVNLYGEKISKRKFHGSSLEFFQQHHYHTEYGRKVLAPAKQENEKLLVKEIIRLNEKKGVKKKAPMDKKGSSRNYSRGVESMLRSTARNQINLSSIADNKSNILISVNAIIMSIIITVLVTRLEEVPDIILPAITFLLSSLITIVFAILSTRPNISTGTFSREDLKQNKVNLLFFGNFYNMSLDEYEQAVGELMKNDDNLYYTMIMDQYSLGKVLVKKYKLLRIAYNVFMFGIIISALSFVFAFFNI